MTAPREAALGIDVGTSSVKAGLVWLDGNGETQLASRRYPTSSPLPGWVEQRPGDWLEALAGCWVDLQQQVGAVRLRSVGVCSQVNTHLLTDHTLTPITPAITWQDTRCAEEAAGLDARVARGRERLWGGPFTIDASFSLARLLWFARHEPAARARARWLLQPRDLMVAALTGEVTSDPISPIGLVGPGDRYLEGVLDLVPGAATLMPPLLPLDAKAGDIRPTNPCGLPAGVPVAVGTMDAMGNVLGSGLVASGRAMEVAGTSEIMAMASQHAVPVPGVISFPPVHGLHIHAGPTQVGGAALPWASALLGLTPEEVLAHAAAALDDPQPIVFLPYLAGERAPIWDPRARGTFLGLTSSTESRHLALAILEGVALAARQVLGECQRAADVPMTSLRLSGGGARSDTWNRVKASAHGRSVEVMATVDSAVLGAALVGMVAAGIERDLASAAERYAVVGHSVEPDASLATRLDDLFGVYQDAYPALKALFPRLGRPAPRP